MKVTDGNWQAHKTNITGQAGLTYVADCYPFNERMPRPKLNEAYANADIIVLAVNACKEINPDNPISVAESIVDMYEALKAMLEGSELDPNNPDRTSSRVCPSSDAVIAGFNALNNVEGK